MHLLLSEPNSLPDKAFGAQAFGGDVLNPGCLRVQGDQEGKGRMPGDELKTAAMRTLI